MASLYQMTFDLETTARAVGVSPVTVKSWMAKGHITRDLPSRPDPAPSGGGGARRSWAFGFCSVMEMAVGQAILNVGPRSLEAAFSAARDFAYLAQVLPDISRAPALPFFEPGVRTLMFVVNGFATIVPWRPGIDPLQHKFPLFPQPEIEGSVFIDCDSVFNRVAAALDLDHDDVLSAARTGASEVVMPHHTGPSTA